MTALPVGAPTVPPTPLTPDSMANIKNRLSLIMDMHLHPEVYPEEMTAAVKSTMFTLVLQDMPALVAFYDDARDCGPCASIHRVHHAREGLL